MIGIGDALDELAAAIFGDDAGRARLAPLLDRWRVEIGELRPEDPQTGLMIATRLDWALVDAAVPGDPHGRSWCTLAASGTVPGVDAALARRCARTHVGLFEVWPAGAQSWLRDRVGGVCVRMIDPIALPPADRGPTALWEVRVLVDDGVAVLCRPALDYPLALVELLRDPEVPLRDREDRWRGLRRGRLKHARTPKLDVRLAFKDAIAW